MLNGLSSQELINKGLLKSGETEKTALGKKNPYSQSDKNLFVDESDISNEAMSLYKRDLDVKKFTNLALSDFDNLDCNLLVLNNVFGAQDASFDDKVIEGIFNSKTFLKDLLG